MFGRKKKLMVCGNDYDILYGKLCRLCALEDDIILTDDERKAVRAGEQCISLVLDAMNNNGKVDFDK